MIDVAVDEEGPGLENAVPRTVDVQIQYYQVAVGYKRLVFASIGYSDHCTTLTKVRTLKV